MPKTRKVLVISVPVHSRKSKLPKANHQMALCNIFRVARTSPGGTRHLSAPLMQPSPQPQIIEHMSDFPASSFTNEGGRSVCSIIKPVLMAYPAYVV